MGREYRKNNKNQVIIQKIEKLETKNNEVLRIVEEIEKAEVKVLRNCKVNSRNVQSSF